MAMNFEAGANKQRGDVWRVDPSSVLFSDAANVSRTSPVDAADIASMAADIRANGQLTAIMARRLADGRIEAIAGFTRLKALLLLHAEEPSWRVKVEVLKDISDADAAMMNMRENVVRNELNPIDRAGMILRLTRDYGMTLAAVAAFFGRGWSKTKVAEVAKFLRLPAVLRARVAAGSINHSQALGLLRFDTEAEMIAAADAAIPAPAALELSPAPDPAEATEATDPTDPADPAAPDGFRAALAARVVPKASSAVIRDRLKAKGVRVRPTLVDFRGFLVARDDSLSRSILGYLMGDIEADSLAEAFDLLDTALDLSGGYDADPILAPSPVTTLE